MSKRFAIGVTLGGALAALGLFACSTSASHPAALGACDSPFGCSPVRPGNTGGGDDAGDGSLDGAADGPSADDADAALAPDAASE